MFFFRIDGTGQNKLLIYANDEPERNANCVAKVIESGEFGKIGPCIVTKREIKKNEELTYSYGPYKYEWRAV